MTILDIEAAVELTEASIYSGKSGFFVNTEFGKVAVEVNLKEFEIPSGVAFSTWESAPNSRWAMKYRHAVCDFHVMVEKTKTKFGTHCRIIQAFSSCLFFHIFNEDVSIDILDAAVKVYLEGIDHQPTSINALEYEYCNNINPIFKYDTSVRELIRDLIVRRDNDALALLEVGEKLSHTSRNGWSPAFIDRFENGYYRDLLHIILFVAELKGRNMNMAMEITGVSTIDITPFEMIDQSRYINGEHTLSSISRFQMT